MQHIIKNKNRNSMETARNIGNTGNHENTGVQEVAPHTKWKQTYFNIQEETCL